MAVNDIKSDFEHTLRELEIMEVDIETIGKKNVSDVVKKYGFFPYSVWRVGDNKYLQNLCNDDIATNTYRDTKAEDPIHRKGAKDKGYKSFNNGLSRFNTAVARRLIEYFSEPGDTVLTPYGSRGIITMVAAHLKRKGICCEVHPKYAEHIQSTIDNLNEKGSKGLFKTKYDAICYNTNCNDMHMIEDDSIDLIVTSPPFYNIEKYESCEGQLSDFEDYEEFMEAYDKCNEEIFRVMKPGGICIFVTNDWRGPKRKGGKSEFIRFSIDTEESLKRAGFETWDIIINFLYSTPNVLGVNKAHEMQRTLKAHETITVMKKPE